MGRRPLLAAPARPAGAATPLAARTGAPRGVLLRKDPLEIRGFRGHIKKAPMRLPWRLFPALLLCALPASAQGDAPEPAPDPAAAACAFDVPLCRRGQAWAKRVAEAGPRTLVGPRLSQEELGELRFELTNLADDIEKAAALKKKTLGEAYAAVGPLLDRPWVNLRWMTQLAASRDLTALGDELARLDRKLARLDIDAAWISPGADSFLRDPLVARLNVLSAEGGELWRRVEALGRNVDGLGGKIENGAGPAGGIVDRLSAQGRLTERLNPFQTQVAGLAERTQRLALKLGVAPPALAGGKADASLSRIRGRLADPFAAARRPLESEGPGPALSPGPPALPSPLIPLHAPGLLEIRRAPAPVGRSWPADRPLFTGAAGRDADPEGTAAVEALRAKGQTKTVGDPVGRAAYVYSQKGETCALAASAQVLAEIHGVKPTPKVMRGLEDQLYAAAVKQGFFAGDNGDRRMRFKGTTPGQYVGSLLGVPVRRTYLATPEQLDASVKTGKMLLVATNAGKLWNDPAFANGGHLIVVTGAEVGKKGGEVLGVYVNDTGTNEGGRFMTRRQFLDA